MAAGPASAITLHLGTAPAELELDINDLPVGQHADVVQLGEFAFSALFDGQTAGQRNDYPGGPFETISGNPTFSGDPAFPLVLGAQGLNRNTETADLRTQLPQLNTLVLGGLLDSPSAGTGALSFMFDVDVLIFGIGVIGVNTADRPGSQPGVPPQPSVFQFFDRWGNQVGAAMEGPALNTEFWFELKRTDDVRGVTITSVDYAGVGYYDMRFETPAAPALLLLPLGICILSLIRRDRNATRPTGTHT